MQIKQDKHGNSYKEHHMSCHDDCKISSRFFSDEDPLGWGAWQYKALISIDIQGYDRKMPFELDLVRA